MSFYSEFSEYYEDIFPFRNEIYSFIKGYINNKANILDIGCGTGNYVNKLISEGFNCSGIDLDKEMINFAVKKTKKSYFHTMNMLDVDSLNEKFDIIYSIGNVIAHINQSDLNSLIQKIRSKLTSKGIWIFQVINWDFILSKKQYTFPDKKVSNYIFKRQYTQISHNKLFFNTELENTKNKKIIFKDKVAMYPIKNNEFIKIHTQEGFKLLDNFANYTKNKFKSNADSANIQVYTLI